MTRVRDNLPNKDPIIYSSINIALKGLQISYSTLLDYCACARK